MRRQPAAEAIDALVVRECAAHDHPGDDFRSDDGLDFQFDEPVGEQKNVARAHVVRQLLVVQADPFRIAQIAFRIEHEARAFGEGDLAFLELADPDLRALQVGHDAHASPQLIGEPAHQLRPADVIGGGAVGKIHAHDVDPGRQHVLEHGGISGSGTECGDDFGGAWHSRYR